MGMTIDIGNKRIYADGYLANPNDLSIQFYREKTDLDYIPPIKVSENMLSDFGREVLEKGLEDAEKNKEDEGKGR